MQLTIKYLKIIGYILASLLILTLIMTILNYFNIISSNTMNYFKLIVIILATFLGGIAIGKQSTKRGWLEGLKLGGILIFILFLFAYLGLDKGVKLRNFIYYLIILQATVLGGMIGINRKINKKT
jgi:putative membrane protein (TIGR04086 family)